MAQSILPERFLDGDFALWLHHFERCALANSWNDETRLVKLPAFLQGPAAAYYEALPAASKDTIAHLTENLTACFSPITDRERHYRMFDEMALRPSEDPTLLLWRLKDTLRKAEPDLSDTAFDALLRRQFMKALPSDLQLKLLESDPTPNLDTMLKFAQRIRALRALPAKGGDFTTCAMLPTDALPPTDPRFPEQALPRSNDNAHHGEIQALTDKVDGLIKGQASLVAALAASSPAVAQPATMASIICFNCNQVGHIARNCPIRQRDMMGSQLSRRRRNRPNIIDCSLCGGQGHFQRECANNRTANMFNNKLSNAIPQQQSFRESSSPYLNFQGVPR